MEDKIPYIVYEGEQARHERTVKRLLIVLAVTVVLLFASNIAWLFYLGGFEFYDDSISVESRDGIANFIGQDGVIENGTSESTSETAD